jgi:hypothetical protein
MKKILLLGLTLLLFTLSGCGGGGPSDDSTPSRVADVTEKFALQSGRFDSFDIEFVKNSNERVRLYLDHPTKISSTIIDAPSTSKGTFQLTCLQVVWWGDGTAEYDCSGVGPDAKSELENLSFRMTLWTDGIYELNTRYDKEPLFGEATHTLQHNGPSNLTITKK